MDLRCYHYGRITLGIALITLILCIYDTSMALAASNIDTNIVEGSPNFNNLMGDWLDAMIFAAKAISTTMIVLGGLNIALNLGNDGLSKVWSAALGIGLILNIGLFFTEATWFTVNTDPPSSTPHFDLSIQSEANFAQAMAQVLNFPMVYHDATVAGANYLVGPATKLLLVLTAINIVIKVSLDLVEGDKIRYLTLTVLETGAYFFLITNWYGDAHGMDIMGSLCEGFEKLGLNAGGGKDLAANDILGNSWQIFTGMYKSTKSGFHPIDSLVTIIFGLIILILLVLTGIEMFMARIEFWTLAMATIPLVPFAALPQTRFLFTSALNGMMNLAIKCSVIAFITAVTTGILTEYVKAFTSDDNGSEVAGNIALFIQALLVSLLLYLLVKKLPQLVSSLLSGRPELSGASMTQMAKSAAQTGTKVGTALATGGTSMIKAGFSGAAQGAGSGLFKAVGTSGAIGKLNQGAGAFAGAMNYAAGSAAAGVGGLAKHALLGSATGGGAGGGEAGGLLGGVVGAVQQGAQLGKNFNARSSLKDKNGNQRYAPLFGSNSVTYDTKQNQVIARDENNQPIYNDDGTMKKENVVAKNSRGQVQHSGVFGKTLDGARWVNNAIGDLKNGKNPFYGIGGVSDTSTKTGSKPRPQAPTGNNAAQAFDEGKRYGYNKGTKDGYNKGVKTSTSVDTTNTEYTKK